MGQSTAATLLTECTQSIVANPQANCCGILSSTSPHSMSTRKVIQYTTSAACSLMSPRHIRYLYQQGCSVASCVCNMLAEVMHSSYVPSTAPEGSSSLSEYTTSIGREQSSYDRQSVSQRRQHIANVFFTGHDNRRHVQMAVDRRLPAWIAKKNMLDCRLGGYSNPPVYGRDCGRIPPCCITI